MRGPLCNHSLQALALTSGMQHLTCSTSCRPQIQVGNHLPHRRHHPPGACLLRVLFIKLAIAKKCAYLKGALAWELT